MNVTQRLSKGITLAVIAALLAGCGGGGGSTLPKTGGGGGGNGGGSGPQSNHTMLAFKIQFPARSNNDAIHGRTRDYVSRSTQGIGVEFQATGGTPYSGAPATSTTGSPALQYAAPIGIAAPGLATAAGTTLTVGTYYVVVTYTDSAGETTASRESSITTTTNNQDIVVTSPPAFTGATGYNVYIGTSSGTETLQNASPITIGTNYTQSAALTAGAALPAANTAGIGCTAPGSDGSYSCTVYIPGPPVGYDDFRIALWNAAPGAAGSEFIAAGDSVLSVNVLTAQVVLAGIVNDFNFTTLPVVNSVAVQLTPGIVDGAASTVNGTITEKDAQGNIILGSDQLVNASDANLTLTPTINNGGTSLAFATPCTGNGVSPCTAPTFQTSASNTFTIAYDGTAQFATSGATQPNVTIGVSGGTIAGTNFATDLQVTTSQNSITVPGEPQVALLRSPLTDTPTSFTYGSDGNFWDVGNGNSLEVIKVDGSAEFVYGSAQGLVGTPSAIVAGSENDLWYTDSANNMIARFAPATPPATITVTETPAITGTPNLASSVMTLGPDGNVWFTDPGNDALGTVNPNNFSAGATEYALATGAVTAIGSGPKLGVNDQSVCATVSGTPNVLECRDIQAGSFASQNIAAAPSSVVTGPDNNVYVGELGQIQVFPVSGGTLGASSATYSLGNAASTVQSMPVCADGNIWFVEGGATPTTFGSLDIQSATPVLTEYPPSKTGICTANATPVAGCLAGATPVQLLLGPASAGNLLYFTDNSANQSIETITP